ncbi:AraC family transcriptional regulator [Rhodocyclus gracilis]|nr:AraC family transcriptional regulator [Rhodocyclus gracilis]
MANDDTAAAPPARASVHTALVRGMLTGVLARDAEATRRIGAPPQQRARALLDSVGIPANVLLSETASLSAGVASAAASPDGTQATSAPQRVSVERYAALYNRINEELDDEGFGLFSVPLRRGSFELLCRAVVASPTLAVALERAARFLRVLLPDIEVSIGVSEGMAQLILRARRPLGDGRVFAFEWLLRLLHGLACWLVNRSVTLDTVRFPYPAPEHAADYALIYTAHSCFAAATPPHPENTLVACFAANLLELPIRRDDAALNAFLVGAPGRLTTLYRCDREMVVRVRDCLRAALPKSPTLAAVASRLHLSPRTLHRRLRDEGSGFQAIKDALRRDMAISRLTKTRAPLAQIAADLGFADASAFYRAFVGWTGEAPTTYRRRLRVASRL